ncbi:fungal-specific transcription factor domain-containing protein [Stachybotrys elegans]|uniref:Fungal-specific transcription factor domain-containing protein n=1 Tax=Stachybotrys elegans TaxID=80388 RepID=A0A8K0SGC5_9HYPO|nr:fungal-specific transcription factor domain-containing protein [Stachybotrys elegans]
MANRRTNGRACTHCRQRKVRCDVLDKGAPCTNCRARAQPDCTMYEASRTRHRSSQLRSSPSLRLIKPRDASALAQSEPTSSLASSECTPSSSRQSATPPAEGKDDVGNIAEFLDQEDLRVSRIIMSGRMCYIGTEMSNFNYLVRQNSTGSVYDDCYHFSNRQFHLKYTSHNLDGMPSDALSRPPKELTEKLLRTYFTRINRGWPIIDEQGFMIKYRGQDPQKPLSLLLLNAALLVGAHVLSSEDAAMKPLKTTLFRRAKTLIDFRYEQDRVAYVQAALLLTWYADGFEELVANAWHWIGMACRTALGLGMHRDNSQSRLLDVSKREWTRLWWVLFQLDTIVSCAYGRPQALNLDESDVPELEPSHFEGIPQAEVDFVTNHTKLCMIISRTMKKRWAIRAPASSRIEATKHADVELAQFLAQLPASLKPVTTWPNIWTSTLHLTYNNFLILLHRPPPKQQDTVCHLGNACDATICNDSTISIATIFEAVADQHQISELWPYGVHSLFTAIVQATNSLNSTNPVVAAKAFKAFDSLLGALKNLSQYWQFAVSLLVLFERRLAKERQNNNPADAGSAVVRMQGTLTDMGHESLPTPGRFVDGGFVEAGNTESSIYEEELFRGIDEYMPLDDILFTNLPFPDDFSSYDGLLEPK